VGRTLSLDEILTRLPEPAREALALRWLGRFVHVHLSALLDIAGDDAGAARLRLIRIPARIAEATVVGDALAEVLDLAVADWHRAIDAARRGHERWERVLDALGPEQVTPWSIYLALTEELTALLELGAEPALAESLALLARRAARSVAELRAGAASPTRALIAGAVEEEEASRQRDQALAALPV